MELNSLTAIGPVDGRYRKITSGLAPFLSEFGLIRYRVFVETEYFIALCEEKPANLSDFPVTRFEQIRKIYSEFSEGDALKVKEIESVTNHDVKAVEYFLKEKFTALGLQKWSEYIHFGLTSQDINNTAIPLSLRDSFDNVLLPALNDLVAKLEALVREWKDIPMLARTHGQPASPTKLGKEIEVFTVRIRNQMAHFDHIPWQGKFGGATGNFNAHFAAYPEIDWHKFADTFLEKKLGLKRSFPTTQIDHYDNLAAWLDTLARINTILIDMARDFWSYISMDYFKQKAIKGEIGSSAMPHKINPIDFENGEGNLGLANAAASFIGSKLPVSRLQRDLTDSTVLRNIGIPLAHSLIAWRALERGLNKLVVNETKLNEDLSNNYVVISEAIQTILRKEGYPKPYEALLELTRTGEKITRESFDSFIDKLAIDEELKKRLKSITPFNYTGK